VTGADAEARCDAATITLNKNAIPYDPQKPMTASGIRVAPRASPPRHGEAEMPGRRTDRLAVRTDPALPAAPTS
jgi:glycine hydroxymethyltransferase